MQPLQNCKIETDKDVHLMNGDYCYCKKYTREDFLLLQDNKIYAINTETSGSNTE